MAFTVPANGERSGPVGSPPDGHPSRGGRGELRHEATIYPGVRLTWDHATPHRYVHLATDCRTEETEAVRAAAEDPGATGNPWLRLAALELLDLRLYAPLDRALFHAEIATVQLAAADTLGHAWQPRETLTRSALKRARSAAPGVARCLASLVGSRQRPPAALEASMAAVADCYGRMTGQLHEFDADFAAVSAEWRRLAAIERTGHPARRPQTMPEVRDPLPEGGGFIDPRHVVARELRLGSTPEAPDIDVSLELWEGSPALRVRVAPFENDPETGDAADVCIRVIDRRSGDVLCHGLLGGLAERAPAYSDRGGDRRYEGVVVLPESVAADDVDVDVYDAAGGDPAPRIDAEERRHARRAAMFLRDWRTLVADVRLWGAEARPAMRLHGIVDGLTDGRKDVAAHARLWVGGPAVSHLRLLVELGDRRLGAMLEAPDTAPSIPGDDDGCAAAIVASVSGPGDLLAAELAAAYERSARA